MAQIASSVDDAFMVWWFLNQCDSLDNKDKAQFQYSEELSIQILNCV